MSERPGFWQRLSVRNAGTQNHQPRWQGSLPLTSNTILEALGLGGSTVTVRNAKQAMGISAANRATNVLAGSLAGCMKQVVDAKTGKVDDSVTIVHQPHPLLDEYIFWEQAMLRLIYDGDFVCIRQNQGAVDLSIKSLLPITNVKALPVTRGKGASFEWVDTLYVWTMPDGEQVGLTPDEVFHVPGLGFDGLSGMSLLSYAQQTFDSVASGEDFAAKFYRNGSLMSGVLTTDKRLDEDAAKGLKERWRQKVQGINNAFDIVVLDSNTKFQPISITPQEAQWLEARQFNITEMARIYGVHPQLLMESSEGVAGADPEQKSTDFVAFTLNHWTNRISAAAKRQILPAGKELRFLTQRLVQPDTRTRSAAGVMWRKANVKSINDLRSEEGLPPIDDPRADDPFYTGELKAAGPAAEPGTNQGNPEPPGPAETEPAAPPAEPNSEG